MRCKGVPELCSSRESRIVISLALNWIYNDNDQGDCAAFLIFNRLWKNLGIFAQDDHAKVYVEGGGETDKGARKEFS